MATPKTVACVAPQVFHGTNTEVTVPESSKVLLNTSGLSPLSRNVFANILPGTAIAIYWSEAVILKKTQVAAVDPTNEPVLFAF